MYVWYCCGWNDSMGGAKHRVRDAFECATDSIAG